VSFFISSRLQREPIYTALAFQDGIHLPTAETRQRHRLHQVAQAMRAATEVLPSHIDIVEALERVSSSTVRAWPITDRRGVIGIVSLATLERACAEGTSAERLGNLVDAHTFPHVHTDQTLDLALERMGAAHLDLLPVVSRADMHKLEGVITLGDLVASFGIDASAEQSGLAKRLGAGNRVPLGVSPCSEGSKTDRRG